jgi:hypothetical protein
MDEDFSADPAPKAQASPGASKPDIAEGEAAAMAENATEDLPDVSDHGDTAAPADDGQNGMADRAQARRRNSRYHHAAPTYTVPRAFKYAHVKAYAASVLARHQDQGGEMDGAKWINPPSGAGLILVGPNEQRLKNSNGKDIRINFVKAAQEGRKIFKDSAEAKERNKATLDAKRLESLERYDAMSATERAETKAWLRTMTVGDQIDYLAKSGTSATDILGRLEVPTGSDEDGGDFKDRVERFFRGRGLDTRYGNFGGQNWTNGEFAGKPEAKRTGSFDDTGQNKLQPIDELDAAFMDHDIAERQAQLYEKKGKFEEARAERHKGDMALLARLDELESQLDAGEVKLGIKGSGVDDRRVLLGVEDPVKARDVMDNAKLFFTLRAHKNSPTGFMPWER